MTVYVEYRSIFNSMQKLQEEIVTRGLGVVFACWALNLSFFGAALAEEFPAGDLESETVFYGAEKPLLGWKELGGSGERAVDEDIVRSTEYVRSGRYSIQFTVGPDSYVARGNRAELMYDSGAGPGGAETYSWSMLVPVDFEDVMRLKDAQGRPNWQVVAQWHHQPVFSEGESWDDFSFKGYSVPLSLNYHYFNQGDPGLRGVAEVLESNDVEGFNPDWDEQPALILYLGVPPVPVAMVPIEKGEWIDLQIDIRWSDTENGGVRARVNDKPFTDGWVSGRTMLNEASHYFKFGLYRNPSILFTNSLFFDDIRITRRGD